MSPSQQFAVTLAAPSLLTSPKHSAAQADAAKGQANEEAPALAPYYAAEWAQAVKRFGDADALIFDGVGKEHRLTFEGLDQSSTRLARGLRDMRIGVGDRLVTIVENRPELVVLILACLKLGVTFVPLATDLRPQDIQGMVARYEPSLIVCDKHIVLSHEAGARCPIMVLSPFEGHDNEVKAMMTAGSDDPLEMPNVPDGVAAIIFSTSGSTALPKGVMNSHADLAALGKYELLDESERAKYLLWVSMRGIGATLLLLKHLLQGALTVMVDSYPSGPEIWGALIDKHGLDSHILFGAAMHQTLQELPGRTFESVRTIFYGGSCFAPTLIQKSMEQFPNAAYVQAYGMTEVHPISLLAPSFHKRAGEATEEDVLRMSSAGKAVMPNSVFIEDLDRPGSGEAPPPEKEGVGQICARSGVTMMGYYRDPEKTRETMPDGRFVRTGDVGRIDEDGFLYILGRVKDIIPAYKGFNVAPRDVEEILYTHADVGQASVVGVWHPSGAGEAVVVWARAKAGARLCPEGLRRHLEGSGMPRWQMPDAIHVANQALPLTSGKIDTKALRAPARRQSQLAFELASARSRRSHDEPARVVPQPREALADELCDGGELCSSRLSSAFGDALPEAQAALEGGRAALLAALDTMGDTEFESFQLGVQSLLGSWAAGKLA